MNRQEKAELVQGLSEALAAAQAIIVTEYRKVPVPKVVALRRQLRESGVQYKVTKNTLAKLAIEGTDKAFLADLLVGPTALAWSDEDPVAAAKILTDFAKDNEGLVIKGAYLTGSSLDAAAVDALSKLPGKDELRSKLLSVLQAPAQKMVTVLTQAQRDLLSVFEQHREKLEG